MKTENKHTPTPWAQRISPTGSVDIIHGTDFICTVGVLPYDGNILEDAAHIVHCVNSHASLVAENKRLREALEGALPALEQHMTVADISAGYDHEERQVIKGRLYQARSALNPEGTT